MGWERGETGMSYFLGGFVPLREILKKSSRKSAKAQRGELNGRENEAADTCRIDQ